MSRYALRRIIAGIPILLGGATAIFLIINLIPGDPAALMLGEYYSEASYQAVKRRLGLDQPLHVRYLQFIGDLVRGDLGTSFTTGRAVVADILDQFPYTAALAVAALVVAVLIGVVSGVTAAVYRNRWIDQLVMLFAMLSVSTPGFWLGVLLILAFAVHLNWLPAIGGGELNDPAAFARYLIMPAVATGLRAAGLVARLTRSSVLEQLGQDYVRTARAKGLPERVVTYRHALRNALLPVVTILGIYLGELLGGATVVEKVFARPGVGKLMVDAVLSRDYPLVQGTMVFFMAAILAANLLTDLAYAVIDPRVSYD